MIEAERLRLLRENLDKYKYGDRTRRGDLRLCLLLLDKHMYTHTYVRTHTCMHTGSSKDRGGQ